jgi:chromosome segregation ATPase
MKLQAPKQLNNELNLQRKNQIDEGVKIATKVDALRQTLASLEQQHTVFLAGSREEAERISTDFRVQKESLQGEIRKLEERKAELMKPLDDEWATLNEAKEQFKLEVADYEIKKDELQEKEKEIKEGEKRLLERTKTLDSTEETIKRVSRETIELNEQAKGLKERQVREYEQFSRDHKERNREIETREKALIVQANYNSHQKAILDKREKQLNDKEKFINDKYNTLLRTLSRINNK